MCQGIYWSIQEGVFRLDTDAVHCELLSLSLGLLNQVIRMGSKATRNRVIHNLLLCYVINLTCAFLCLSQ